MIIVVRGFIPSSLPPDQVQSVSVGDEWPIHARSFKASGNTPTTLVAVWVLRHEFDTTATQMWPLGIVFFAEDLPEELAGDIMGIHHWSGTMNCTLLSCDLRSTCSPKATSSVCQNLTVQTCLFLSESHCFDLSLIPLGLMPGFPQSLGLVVPSYGAQLEIKYIGSGWENIQNCFWLGLGKPRWIHNMLLDEFSQPFEHG